MKRIPGSRFEHRLGRDCATAAMRNLLSHYGLDLSEAMVFGLGEGLASWYCHWDFAPFPVLITQNPTLEADLARNLGFALTVVEPGEPAADIAALKRVREGTPVIVKADPYDLSYCWRDGSRDRRHFGEHILVVAAIDGEEALISDIWSERLERAPLAELQAARWASEGEPYLLPRGRWYDILPPQSFPELAGAGVAALRRAAARNLEPGDIRGIAGLRACADRLPGVLDAWAVRGIPDRKEWISIISMRMDEGGLRSGFRTLFFDFLDELSERSGEPRYARLASTYRGDVESGWRRFLDRLQDWRDDDEGAPRRTALGSELARTLRALAGIEESMWKELWK